MVGCKPLSKLEIEAILNELPTLRDKTLFILGLYTGFRIKECLSLKVADVKNNRLEVKRCNMKGKYSSRSIIIHPILKIYLNELIASMGNFPEIPDSWYLFRSKKGLNKPLGRMQAWYILNKAVKKLGLEGKISLHSTRKTFADKVYKAFDKDLLKTSKALGHRNISSTISYLSFKTEELDKVVSEIDLGDDK